MEYILTENVIQYTRPLSEFAKKASQSDDFLLNLINLYGVQGRNQIDESHKFSLISVVNCDQIETLEHGMFETCSACLWKQELSSNYWVDGQMGLGLALDNSEIGFSGECIALVSFSLPRYDPELSRLPDITENSPVILQLQGPGKKVFPDNKSYLRNRTNNLLQKFRWEFVLTGLTRLWAEQNGFKSLYVQSAEKNQWVINGFADYERVAKRYNQTAQDFGFKRRKRFYILEI